MRSVIQLAGRILRHRELEPNKVNKVNILILNRNIESILKEWKENSLDEVTKKSIYTKPGYENLNYKIHKNQKFLNEQIKDGVFKSYIENINSIPRIDCPSLDKINKEVNKKKAKNLYTLEHTVLYHEFCTKDSTPYKWNKTDIFYTDLLQKKNRFRGQDATTKICCWNDDGIKMKQMKRVGTKAKDSNIIGTYINLFEEIKSDNFWINDFEDVKKENRNENTIQIYYDWIDPEKCSENKGKHLYNPILGVWEVNGNNEKTFNFN
jgi:hypothetical protein